MRSVKATLAAMRGRLARKLVRNAGETLVETLVAMLVAALSLVMLAGAISSAVNVVNRSSEAADRYYAASNVLATGVAVAADAESGAQAVGSSGTGEVTIQVKYFGGADQDLATVPINYVLVEDLPGNVAAVSYRAQG